MILLGHGLGGMIETKFGKRFNAFTDSWHIFTNVFIIGISSGYNLYFNNDNTNQKSSDGSIDNFTATTFGFNANGGNDNG